MNETQEQMLADLRIYSAKEDRACALDAGPGRLTITDARANDGSDLYVVLVAVFDRKDGDEAVWAFPIGDVFHITDRSHLEAAADGTAGVAKRMDKGGWSGALLASFDTSAVAGFSEWKGGKLKVEYVAIGRDESHPGIQVLYRGPSKNTATQIARRFSE